MGFFVSDDLRPMGGEQASLPFRFPSTGKAYPKHRDRWASDEGGVVCVSIPFNREGVAKRPYFKSSGAVAPQAQKYTRTAWGFFLPKF